MPRTYSFDHFTAQKVDSSKHVRFAGPGRSASAPIPIRYGKKFAQTEELYHAHEMEQVLEELVKEDTGEDLKAEGSAPRMSLATDKPSEGAPIGALPPTPEVHPMSLVREAYDDAVRQWQALEVAARDFSHAGRRLAALPAEIIKLSLRRILP